jgi:RNA polymerase sigma-54 factor
VNLQQKQTLSMIPQIIQSVEILQLPMQTLQERVEQELAENPVLEVADTADTATEQSSDDGSATPESIEAESAHGDTGDFESTGEFEHVESMAESYPDVFDEESYTGRRPVDTGEKDRKLDIMQNTPGRSESLQDHLYQQLTLDELTEHERRIAENVVYNIDDNGYLQFPLEEIARSMDEPAEIGDLERVLELVQTLEPLGVGARSLKECLLIQARAEMGPESLEARIVEEHLDDVEHGRFDRIAAALDMDEDEVRRHVEHIAHLNPRPGAAFSNADVPFVVPDVIVEKSDSRFEVRLADDRIPPLYVSDAYRHLLKRGSKEKKTTKEFLRNKIQSARWLIEAIEQRRNTLRRVSQAIVAHQVEFMDRGLEGLRPLRMKQIAEEVDVHVATVCRAVANKYMETPQGVYEMKYFFPSGYTSDTGEEISDEVVRESVARAIENEDKSRPLSDEAIVKILNDEGIPIARRTITKYRKILGIPSSRQRKIT